MLTFYQRYLRTAFQALPALPVRPPWFTTPEPPPSPASKGPSAPSGLFDWALARQDAWDPQEWHKPTAPWNLGTLMLLQLVAAYPDIFALALPVLTPRLVAFAPLLFTVPPTLSASHLTPALQDMPTTRRLHGYREQLHRTLDARPELWRLWREALETLFGDALLPAPRDPGVAWSLTRFSSCVGLRPDEVMALDPLVSHKPVVGPFHSTLAEEFRALLTAERRGAVPSTEYVAVKPLAMAWHLVDVGEISAHYGPEALTHATIDERVAWATGQIFTSLRIRFNPVFDSVARVFFKRCRMLREAKVLYDPEQFVVLRRKDVELAIKRLENPGEAVDTPAFHDVKPAKTKSYARRTNVRVHFSEAAPKELPLRPGLTRVPYLWRNHELYVDAAVFVFTDDTIPPEHAVYLLDGRPMRPAPGDRVPPDRVFISRAYLLTVYSRLLLDEARNFFDTGFPESAIAQRASLKTQTVRDKTLAGKRTRSTAHFTLVEDAIVLDHYKRWMRESGWEPLLDKLPRHSRHRITARGKFLRYMAQRHAFTIAQSRDIALVETHLNNKAREKFATIYKEIE